MYSTTIFIVYTVWCQLLNCKNDKICILQILHTRYMLDMGLNNRGFLLLTFYPMSILRKIAVFIEEPPVTSSNCYETMKML
jgi:hypothetical protein